jgi:hypothetical protein
MAAYTKGTQTLAGLSKKPDWAKPIKINAGIRNPELLGRMSQQSGMEQQSGAVGSSFGRMMGGSPQMGGGMGGMRDLEAASMRLADAATKRDIQRMMGGSPQISGGMGGSPQMGGGMGGGMGMGGLEAASMRLADAASKREMQESEYKMKLNKALELGYSSIEERENKLGRKNFSAKTSAGNNSYNGMRTFNWGGGVSGVVAA